MPTEQLITLTQPPHKKLNCRESPVQRKGDKKHISEFLAEESPPAKLRKGTFCLEKTKGGKWQNDAGRKHPAGQIIKAGHI